MRTRLEEALATGTDPMLVEMAQGMLADGGPRMGVPAARITTRVDVSRWVDRKRLALSLHASQVPPDSWWMTTPEEEFATMFGTECFILRGAPPGLVEDHLELPARA